MKMVEMISEYADDAVVISFQFWTNWKSIVMNQKVTKLVMKLYDYYLYVVIRDPYGQTYYFRSLKGRNAVGMSKW